jgi:hypothetical protein
MESLEVGMFESMKKKDGGESAKSLLLKYGIVYLASHHHFHPLIGRQSGVTVLVEENLLTRSGVVYPIC